MGGVDHFIRQVVLGSADAWLLFTVSAVVLSYSLWGQWSKMKKNNTTPVPNIITQVQRTDTNEQSGGISARREKNEPVPIDPYASAAPSFLQRLLCCFSPRQYPPDLQPVAIGSPDALLPPPSSSSAGKICLLLDLDETLVHSSFQPVPGADFHISVEIEMQKYEVYVSKRPFVDEFLLEMGKHFEVVIFTASLPKYADPVLDLLDIHHVCEHRLFREHCTFTSGSYVKDLSKVGRELNRTLIIDNSAPSFRFHPDHSILCTSWFDDVNDTELRDIIPFLVKLSKEADVRSLLKEWKEGRRDFS